MRPSIYVTKSSAIDDLNSRLRTLQQKDVLVGIPQANSRRKGEINNAQLLYIHTHGSALQHIPARPVIEPAIAAPDNKANISAELKDAAQSVLEGRATDASVHLDKAGQVGANAAVRWFTDPRNNWAPNAPGTIREKGSDRPLIDTGELRRSITYVVEDR